MNNIDRETQYHEEKRKRKERKKRREREKTRAHLSTVERRRKEKKEQRAAERISCTEEVVPRAVALALHTPPISSSSSPPPPPHGPVSFSRNILHREGSEKENRLEWLIREERAECVCKSFKRPVKKLHWRPASAVKHKANYRLNIFRYILSCRDRRGLRSLFFDLNHPLLAPILPFSFAARVATPDDEPDEHDRGSLSTTIDETERYIQGPSSTLPSFPRLLPS